MQPIEMTPTETRPTVTGPPVGSPAPAGAVVVGLDVGGTKILGLSIAADGPPRPVRQQSRPTPRSADALIEELAAVAELVADGAAIARVGVGVPGFIDMDGIPRQAPNLPGVVGVDVGALLRERLRCEVVVDNDANCAAWAAARTDATAARDVVAVTLGTGIGGGLVVDGKLVRGAHGFAGEPGHMIVDPGGPACACGQRGCWEVWASGTGLGRLAAVAAERGDIPLLVARFDGAPDGPEVTAAARSDDDAMRREAAGVLEAFAGWVAVGIVNLVNLLDPELVLISGGIVAEGDLILDRVRAAVSAVPTMVGGRTPRIEMSAVGPAAGALGAALLAAR
jgi:glucokinase